MKDEIVSRIMSEMGRKGGKKGGTARASNMTPEQRSESARNAVTARWERRKAGAFGDSSSSS